MAATSVQRHLLRLLDGGARATASVFRGRLGTDELHLLVEVASTGGPFADEARRLGEAWAQATSALGFGPGNCVFRRLFVTDLGAQRVGLEASALLACRKDAPAAISVVEQPPLGMGRVALWSYHLEDAALEREQVPNGVALRRGPLTHLWTADHGPAGGDAAAQTTACFEEWTALLHRHGARLSEHAVRTWLFLRDVDRDYRALVQARRELFTAHGLTAQTHFITSTGIQGARADAGRLVSLDGYAVVGLRPVDRQFLEAPGLLGPTSRYGVTFERGLRVRYRDRSQVFLSGTASIDPEGRVVHEGDPAAQAARTCRNIEGLLADAQAQSTDVVVLLGYVRNEEDHRAVREVVEARFPGVPLLVTRAPVCRPAWLVELECLAVTAEELDPSRFAF